MKHLRPWYLPLGCVAVLANGAQPRAPVQKAPHLEPRSLTEGQDPCDWMPCFASARSRAVALSWANGTDERGAPLDAIARMRKRTEAENWLRRLEGTFIVYGTYRNRGGKSPVNGTAKCLGIGGGPGFSCTINANWKPAKESYRDPAFDKSLRDAMQSFEFVFGIDPDTSEIRATLIDQRALQVRGLLVDDEVTFSGEQMSLDTIVRYTWDSSFVAIRPGGEVNMKFAVRPTDVGYTTQGLHRSALQPGPNAWMELDLLLRHDPAHTCGSTVAASVEAWTSRGNALATDFSACHTVY